jgi:hypothetical protein
MVYGALNNREAETCVLERYRGERPVGLEEFGNLRHMECEIIVVYLVVGVLLFVFVI